MIPGDAEKEEGGTGAVGALQLWRKIKGKKTTLFAIGEDVSSRASRLPVVTALGLLWILWGLGGDGGWGGWSVFVLTYDQLLHRFYSVQCIQIDKLIFVLIF